MKLIIGLGNPGKKYRNNRHNAGRIFIFHFSFFNEFSISNFQTLISDHFMNDSGEFVREKLNLYKVGLDDLYVVHDDLDIPLGQYKIQKGIGPKVHNGVNSVEQVLGRTDFWRIRIGVDAREKDEGERVKGEKYVLEDFSKEELEILKGVFDAIVKNLAFGENLARGAR